MNIKFRFIAVIVVSLFMVCSGKVFADVHMKMRVMNGLSEMEVWVTDKKQRTRATVPMMGEMVTVSMLEEGIEREILVAQGFYSEKPIALPYKPGLLEEEKASLEQVKSWDYFQKDAEEESPCTPEIRKLKDKRTVAGHEAVGYEAACEGEAAKSTIWMLIPGSVLDPLHAMVKESKQFSEELLMARYENFPKEEREAFVESGKKMGAFLGNAMFGMPDVDDLPEGLPVLIEAHESFDGSEGQGMVVFEVIELSHEKAPSDLFELKEGLTQVEDISEAMAGQMLNQLGMGQLGGMMEALGESASRPALMHPDGMQETTQPSQSDLPPGMRRRPGPNGWVIEPIPEGEASEPPSSQENPFAALGQLAQQFGQQGGEVPTEGEMDQFTAQIQQLAAQFQQSQGQDTVPQNENNVTAGTASGTGSSDQTTQSGPIT